MLRGGKQLNETIEKNINKFKEGKVLNMDLYNRSVNEELSQTLTDPTHNSQRLYDGLRIRKLTPKETWRLMGFDDKDFEKAEKVNSNTQLYKQAGNSIVVNVLEKILNNLIDKNEHVKILELFGGIGACSKALERLGIDYEIADYVEIDKYAVKSFNAIHNTEFEPQDITKWDKDIECDLIMHGSPCQDFSLAGKQAGGDEGSGTRSSLMYETVRIVEKLKPKYVIWENVKNVISKKHKHNFDNYIQRMEELGYISYYQVLNAKDYGIPQNRERVFTISIRKDIYFKKGSFWFPPKQELKLKLKDMLENEVDEKYYLSDDLMQHIQKTAKEHQEYTQYDRYNGDLEMWCRVWKEKSPTLNTKCQDTKIYVKNRLSSTLDTMQGGYRQPCIECDEIIQVGQLYGTKKEPNPQDGRIYDKSGLIPTLDTKHTPKLLIKNATEQGYLEAKEGDNRVKLYNDYKKFNPLNVSSKFAICGLPIRVDTYKNCTFGCKYCFANCRKVMEFGKEIQIGNLKQVEKLLHKIFDLGEINKENLLEVLISQKITWHCGGMSDPFQPIEKELGITKRLIDLSNKYKIPILFSTKSDTVYDCNINPELHTFQLSITNIYDRKDIEPNVSSIDSRYEFYKNLKDRGFKVGIRIQPFLPNITDLKLVEMFKDADNFTLEGIKIVPQNKEHKEYILKTLNLDKEDFTQMGLLNLKPTIRLEMYKPFIDYFKQNNIPFSIADNDLHYIGTNKCCCGDNLVSKSTNFNNTAMLKKYGNDYTIENIYNELGDCTNCKCNHLFTSNRQEGCKTVKEFYNKRFDRKSSPFSPKFLYYEEYDFSDLD